MVRKPQVSAAMHGAEIMVQCSQNDSEQILCINTPVL